MPDDSFVLKYFNYLKKYLSVGPPFYIVVNSTHLNLDYANENITNKICGAKGCDAYSLQNQVYLWSLEPETTRIASPAFSWIDDYRDWLSKYFVCK